MNQITSKQSKIDQAHYDHQVIETQWQAFWEKNQFFQDVPNQVGCPDPAAKLFLLFAFAYPSGAGLHVGHVESKTALDILARYYRMNGKQVYFPVGWDAFGLPAENYAIKTGVPPAKTTTNAINTFRRQIKRLGISYDWSNEIATSHPGYYRWTQWLFLQLFQQGLAYQKTGMVNWCPSCQTVLANEQVVDGRCERCDSEVVQKELEQWYFKITEYKDELLSGLEEVDWPEATKQHQRNWIGKKEGIDIVYEVIDVAEGDVPERATVKTTITCFTTRPDTNFGATFIVLAPEHEFAQKVAQGKVVPAASPDLQEYQPQAKAVQAYIKKSLKKTELERQQEGKKKTGVFTGFYAINNLNGKKMPIWVSDFVLGGFGTGAVVGVPGHDKRDFEFAQTFDLEVIRVVVASDGDDSPIDRIEQVQEEEGTMVNSKFLNGLDIHEAIQRIMDHLEEKGWGKRATTYKLRDWLISRQRYWGAPIPIIYDPEGRPHPVKEEHLPWSLPTDVDFKPTGESPLRSSQEFIERTEQYAAQYFASLIKEKGWDAQGKGWQPEFDTMDTFVDSSWYFMRYCDARNTQEFAHKQRLAEWLPVDLYLIGPEHIVLHLLYSRFFTKFLRDQGYFEFGEPFAKMRHQGMILGPDGKKMSKSKGNVINPDEVVEEYGADTLRVYEMFIGPLEADKPWDIRAVAGVHRFLGRVYRLVNQHQANQDRAAHQTDQPDQSTDQAENQLKRKLHQTIKKVTNDIPKLKFNTAIAAMMELSNEWASAQAKVGEQTKLFSDQEVAALVRLMAPLAPFLAEELYQSQHEVIKTYQDKNCTQSVHLQAWPEFDSQLAEEELMTIAVQVNGKVRGQLTVDATQAADEVSMITQAKKLETVKKWLEGKKVVRELYIPRKIVSLVVAD